jgi:hypothetical protein
MRYAQGLILVLLLALLAAPTAAQFTSMKGDWWFKVTGDKGALALTFDEEVGSSFGVTGGGISTGFQTLYAVSNDTPQALNFDFDGKISGVVALEDFAGLAPLGTLEISTGTVDELFEFVKLKGFLTLAGGEPRKVRIRGERLPATPPDWTGRTHRGRLGGSGVKSRKYDITLMDLPTQAFPFLALTGEGSVLVDDESRTGVVLGGVLIATPEGRLFGEFAFDTETGVTRGRVRKKFGEDPVLRLRGKTTEDRTVRIKAKLDIPIVVPAPPAQ